MEVNVRRPGMQTTVQDLGRAGFRADGVPLGGAMDRFALRVANLLVGNDPDAGALEFTLFGPELEFSHDALVAVAGGNFVGDVAMWRPILVPAKTALRFGAALQGCRGYLAVAGGFDVPRVLGSSSVYLPGKFGGGFGRALREGDSLTVPDLVRRPVGRWRIDPRLVPPYSANPVVRVIRGAQASEYARTFFDSAYTVTAQSDRMGIRLKGAVLVRQSGGELRSAPVVPGTIQVPPDGQPIVLMADAQTIGGYPQIAHVTTVDLPLMAQLRPGDAVSFRDVTLDEAHELASARERALAMLQYGLARKFT